MRCTVCGQTVIRYDYGSGMSRRYRWTGREGPKWFWNSSHANLNDPCIRCYGKMEVVD